MSLSEVMVIGGNIDYTSYRSKNPEKCNEIESRYHLRRCRNLLQFIVSLLIVFVLFAILVVLASVLGKIFFIGFILELINDIGAIVILLIGAIMMISNFKTEVRKTNDAEKAELDAL